MSTTTLLTTHISPDWEERTRERAVRQARYWTALQLGLVFGTLLVVLLRLFFPSRDWLPIPWAAGFIAFAWTLPLISIFRAGGRAGRDVRRTGLAALGVVCAALGVVCAGAPGALAPGAAVTGLELPSAVSLFAPMLTWSLLAWTHRRFPLPSQQMGLTLDRWLVNTAMGMAAGAALGLSLVAVAGSVGGLGLSDSPAIPTLAWLLAYEIGLRAPGEELLFRGLVYRTVVGDPSANVVAGIARVILLNLLVYVVPVVFAATIGERLAIIVYGAALACTSTLLRHYQRSLLPGIAANVVFSAFAASVIR